MNPVSEIPGLLQGLSFFRQLTHAEINLLAPLCTVREGQAGERLIEQNDQVRDLFFLLSGEADVIKKGPGGKPCVLASLNKGTVLGEMSFFDQGVASATVKTRTPFRALIIQQTALQKLLDMHPALGYKIVTKIAELISLRLRKTSNLRSEHA
ncbi:MAG: cyclic nucleotide-binding domain-containing protein [Nitrospirae bacterium]|nr:MAG: cyclic nucleotide-binding domain-containing protein [Nitrospirota bacterium]